MTTFEDLITPDGYIVRGELLSLRDRLMAQARDTGRPISEQRAFWRAHRIAVELYRTYYGQDVPGEKTISQESLA